MGTRYDALQDCHREFVARQPIFFVATAAPDGRVNVSPKGLDTLRVLSPERILWLSLSGSGNETAAHLRVSDRMTMMFCSFDEQPMILRCYGSARAIPPRDADWPTYAGELPPHKSARQLVLFDIELVQTSCGFGVPMFEFASERDNMDKWLSSRDHAAIEAYWAEKNQVSLDGLPTGIFEDTQ